jgi:hypothetical protein
MSKESLQKQADRAENIAEQTVDDALKDTLRDAAREYREKAKQEVSYALFRGDTRLSQTFPTEEEVLKAALAEGLIPEASGTEILPPGYRIAPVEQPYDPQPDWNLPREIS